jgi:sarcosine/dimethylglycine N-methyltransferase
MNMAIQHHQFVPLLTPSGAFVRQYYNVYGHLYKPLWGANIHWGLFREGAMSLASATARCTEYMIGLVSISASDRVLDIGCGPACSAAIIIQNTGAYVVGIDVSEYQLDRAREEAAEAIQTGRLKLVQGDVQNYDFKPEAFTVAWSQATFFHLHHRQSMFNMLAQTLVRGGRVVFDDLILKASVDHDTFVTTFGRLGVLKLETEQSYIALCKEAGFNVSTVEDISEDLSVTYQQVLNNLDRLNMESPDSLKLGTYERWRESFGNFVRLIRKGKLGCMIFLAHKQ